MATLAACPNVGGEDLGPRPARAAVDGRGQPRHRAHDDRPLRRRALHVREQLSRSTACARRFATIFAGFREIVRDFPPGEQRALFRDNAMRIYAHGVTNDGQTPPRLCRRRPDGPADGQAAGVARLRGPRVRHRAATDRSGARGRRAAARIAGRRRARRATSCCSTCRRPRRSSRRCSATDGVASALAAAAARRSISRRSRSTRARAFAGAAARRDRLRLDRRAGLRRAAGVGQRHAHGDGGRRGGRHRARGAAHGATSPAASRTWGRPAAASSRR